MIAVIAALIALLPSAVQGAREAARCMQCTNTLKQVTLAVMNCESVNAVFPAQSLGPMSVKSRPDSAVGWEPSWIVPILQHTEPMAAYNACSFSANPCVPAPGTDDRGKEMSETDDFL